MRPVESSDESEGVRRYQRGSLLPGKTRGHPTNWIDGGRNTGVRRAQNPSVVLDGAPSGLIQMLGVSAAVAIPPVIRDIHEYLRAVPRKLADLVRENRLVADERPQPMAGRNQRTSRIPMLKLPDLPGESSGKRKDPGEWQIFSERHQMRFVVARLPFAIGADQNRGIK
jgi:hypothetical protein